MASKELKVKVSADITGFKAAMRSINAEILKTSNAIDQQTAGFRRVGDTLSNVGSKLALGVTAPLAAFSAIAIKSFGDIDALSRGLEAVTGSAAEAARQFDRLRDVARLPGLGFQEAVRGAINLQAVGFSAQQSERFLRAFGNALAQVGRGKEDLDEVIRQLGQLANRGKVTADNLKPILERVPQAAKVIKDAFGTIDTEALQKMGISAGQFIEVLVKGLEKLRPATGGIKNEIENLQDTIQISLAEAGKALAPFATQFLQGFVVPAVEKIQDLSKAFQRLDPVLQNTAIGFAAFAAAVGPLVFVLGGLFRNIGDIVAFAPKLAAALTAMRVAAVAAAPEILVLASAVALLWGGKKLWDEFTERVQKVRSGLMGANAAAVMAAGGADGLNASLGKADKQAGAAAGSFGTLGKSTEKARIGFESLEQTLDRMTKRNAANDVVAKFVQSTRLQFDALRNELVRIPEIADIGISDAIFDSLSSASGLAAARDAGERIAEEFVEAQQRIIQQNRLQAKDVFSDLPINALPQRSPGRDIYLQMGKDLGASMKEGAEVAKRALREVSTVLTDMSRNIANLIFEGGKFRDVMIGIAKEAGQAITRFLLQEGFMAIGKQISGILKNLPLMGKLIGKFFGAGSSVASKLPGLADLIPLSPIKEAGKLASTAVSASLSSIVGMATGVVSAVSGIIGNFQMAGMSKDLGKMERTLAGLLNQVRDGIQPQINQYLPALSGIHERLIQMLRDGLGVFPQPGYSWAISGGGAGGLNITQNFDGAYIMSPRAVDDIADAIVDSLRRRGVKI